MARSRLAPLVSLFALVVGLGCGGGSSLPQRGPLPDSPPPLDPGLELAARLPRGATQCTVARVGMLSSIRRSMLARMTHTNRIAWLPNAPIAAVASAALTLESGGQATVILARTTAPPDEVRRWFDEHAGLSVLWAGSRIRSTPMRASFDDPETLRIEQGRFFESPRMGVEARCLELAAAMPDAVEVAARRSGMVLLGDFPQIPRAVESTLVADGRRVVLTRRMLMSSTDVELGPILDLAVEGPEIGSLPLAAIADDYEQVRDGPLLITRTRLLWEDLGFALEDERRVDAAQAQDDRSRRARPGSEVDVTNLAVVEQQRDRWKLELERARGDARVGAARELVTLLTRAIVEHSSEAELRIDLIGVYDAALGDGDAAARVAEDALRDGVGQAEYLRSLRRAALALTTPDRLARALAEDAIVPGADASRAAADLVALRGSGRSYAFAEGAWIGSRALTRKTSGLTARRVAPVTLPLETILDALAVLVEARGHSGALWASIEAEARPWGADQGADSNVIELDMGGARRLFGVASVGAESLGQLGRELALGAAPGEVTLSFFVVPFGGSEETPLAWGRLEGSLDEDHLTLERVAGTADRLDWDRVSRYLAEPLRQASSRTFPPPDVTIDASTTRDAEALLTLADADTHVRCRRHELRLTCVANADQSSAIRGVLVDFATAFMGREAALLVPRRD